MQFEKFSLINDAINYFPNAFAFGLAFVITPFLFYLLSLPGIHIAKFQSEKRKKGD